MMASLRQVSSKVFDSDDGGFYRAYGLAVRSELCLPELTPGPGPADVEISIRTFNRKLHRGNPPEMGVDVSDGATWLSHPAVGTFRICDGRSIDVEPAEGVDDHLLRLFLLGPALGILLRQRGRLTLHASGVAVDGAAVLFVGDSGAGKSTLAAAFHARGCRLIADDIVSVDATGHPCSFPGFPQLKLDAHAATAARITTRRSDTPHGSGAKECFAARRGFDPNPLPLKRVYVLAEDPERDSIEPLQPSEALLELLRHSYGARPLQALNRQTHFKQCAAVARIVPVRRLKRRMGLTALMALADVIENDLANIT